VSTPQQGSRPIRFAAVGLDHAHAFGQIDGLLNQAIHAQQSATMVGFAR
jgi:hypothetical protein